MQVTGGSVDDFVATVTPQVRRHDAATLIEMFRRVTGLEPELWGTIIGFGACHYLYPTGTQGDMPLAAFSPRKASMTLYLMEGFDGYADELAALGPHTVSKACLYIKDLSKVDLAIVEKMVTHSYELTLDNGFDGMDITITDGPGAAGAAR